MFSYHPSSGRRVTRRLSFPYSLFRRTFIPEIRDALGLVSDKNDAPFAGLAIKLRPSIILTYNKRHFSQEGLGKHCVKVLGPGELAEYLDMVIRINKKVKRKGGILKLISGLYLLKSKGKRI